MTDLAVGTMGIDSGRHINAAEAHAAGVRFQMRYSAGEGNSNPASAWKLCGQHEIAEILAAGSRFGANSEWYEDRCTEGKNAGKADGEADLHFWKSRGLVKGASIYISWDKDPSRLHYHGVSEYLKGYREALGGYYLLDGMYAGIGALIYFAEHDGIRHGWVPSAPSWTGSNHSLDHKIAPPAVNFWDLWEPTHSQIEPAIEYLSKMLQGSKLTSAIWQCGNYAFDKSADVNYILKPGPMGMMVPNKTVESAPKPAPRPTHIPPVAKPEPKPEPKPVEVHHPAPAPAKEYVVEQGDSLVRIAEKHNTTWQTLYKLNRNWLKNPNMIRPGDKIKLP